MLTIFACPKPFTDPHIAIIQRNAIASWTLLRPRPEILLFGHEAGVAEICQEFGLRHVPEVARNQYGTPLLNDIFDTAQRLATHNLLAYVNADIILLSDFPLAIRRIPFRRFLMVGQRWDVDVKKPQNFEDPVWENRLREYARIHGNLHPIYGIDYFVFPPGLWDKIPPFAIGRTVWDNWLIYGARACGAAVVDATRAVLAIHQNHDYTHVPDGTDGVRKGPEAQRNLELAGGYDHHFTLQDATWLLTPRWLLPAWTTEHLRRRWVVHCTRGKYFLALASTARKERRPWQAVRYLLKALCHSPLLLLDRHFILKIIQSAPGARLLARYRSWRHKSC